MTEQAVSPHLSVAFVVTAEDLVATNRIAERDGRPMLFVTGAVLVLLGAVLWPLSSLLATLPVLAGLAATAVALAPPLWRRWIARSAGSLIGERRQFAFDREGVHEVSAGIRHTLPWSTFTQLRITSDSVSFVRDGRLIQAIPARAFESPDGLQQLIDLATASAPHVRITWE